MSATLAIQDKRNPLSSISYSKTTQRRDGAEDGGPQQYSRESSRKSSSSSTASPASWTFANAFRCITDGSDDDQRSLLSRMDTVRMESTKASMRERILYCQFWCCMDKYMRVNRVEFSDQQLVFEVDGGVVTDCFWFELQYHIYMLVRELIPKINSIGPVVYEDKTLRDNVRKTIGCYMYLRDFGMDFTDTEAADVMERLADMVKCMRLTYIYMCARGNLAASQWLTGVCYSNAFLDDVKPSVHFPESSIDDLRVDMLKGWSQQLLSTGERGPALKVLEMNPRLSAEALAMASIPGAKDNQSCIPPLMPRFDQPVLVKGDDPLREKCFVFLCNENKVKAQP